MCSPDLLLDDTEPNLDGTRHELHQVELSLLVWIVAIFFNEAAISATLKSIVTKEGHVLILISGQVAEGDADALKAAIKSANDAGKFVSGVRLSTHRISVGKCPHSKIILVGRSEQLQFIGYEGSEYDTFGDIVRVHPNPPKAFTSYRIPRTLRQSLLEADLSLQVGANIAACMMLVHRSRAPSS
jgi:hypothetical protein